MKNVRWDKLGRPTFTKKVCHQCHTPLMYSSRYKADFCPHCNKWIERKRPKTPLDALNLIHKEEEERGEEQREFFYYDWPN